MANVYSIFFIMIGILLSLPALLVALNLLLPRVTGRAATRIVKTPGWCFVMGVPVAAAAALWIAIASNVPSGIVQGSAWVVGVMAMSLGTVGAAGMARVLGDRVSNLSDPKSNMTNLIRGAVLYEFACLFPVVGWFFFAPIVGITVMGATVFALLKWVPRVERTIVTIANGVEGNLA